MQRTRPSATPGTKVEKSRKLSTRIQRPRTFDLGVATALEQMPRDISYGRQRILATRIERSEECVSQCLDPAGRYRFAASDIPRVLTALGTVQPLRDTIADMRVEGEYWDLVPRKRRRHSTELLEDTLDGFETLNSALKHVREAVSRGEISAEEARRVARVLGRHIDDMTRVQRSFEALSETGGEVGVRHA
jgi:hypothetical protein